MENTEKTIFAPTGEEDKKAPKKAANKPKKIEIRDDVLIDVQSNFHGGLIYKNNVSGEAIIWDRVGEIQQISMRELRAMKAQQISFFKNQWIIVLGVSAGEECEASAEEICKTLTVAQYYKNYFDATAFNKACSWSINEIKKNVSLMSEATKQNLSVALKGYLDSGKLDSISKVKAFEEALGCELR